MAVENLEDVRGYATSDVFTPHPTRPGLWRIVGRTDDVIVLRSGEKVVPLPQEDYLNSVPMVSSAIMFGRGQSQPGVVIELMAGHTIDPKDEKAVIDMRNQLWPHIEEANKRAPAFARLFKETIIIADPAKPFTRAAKGTAIRKVVIRAYEQEIDDLYEKIEESADSQGLTPPEAWTPQKIEVWLAEHAATINKGQLPSSSVDLFEQGFDSLSATFLRNRIIAALRSSEDKVVQAKSSEIGQDFVFKYPTLSGLSFAIAALVNPEFKDAVPLTLSEEIQSMIAKYSANLPSFETFQPPKSGAVVLLTGSTGALGCHLLSSLLSDDSVVEVITLNRGSDVAGRQRVGFEDRGLSTGLLSSSKWTSLVGTTTQVDLGLDNAQAHVVKSRVTHVIHNAWKVDFNLSLGSFEGYVASTRSLIDFSASCENPVRLLFTSSAAAVYAWDVSKGAIPEEVMDDPSVAAVSGYGASKFVAEHILAHASSRGMSAISARIGQICGSTTSGDWNPSEWFPALVKTSLALGCLPDLNGPVSWIPIDITAHSVVDVLLSESAVPTVFNVVHPRPAQLSDIFTALNNATETRLEIIPFIDWVRRVEALSTSTSSRDIEIYPAVKLLRFWQTILQANARSASSENTVEAAGLPVLQTTKAEELSLSLRAAVPVGKKEVDLWLQYWRKVNFISL
ncbi:hypothetical protein EIP91_007293 [Steccherinum ochraceum]|uniref:Thioester reductase (TE) domain-containing protein n=1 Tax=Steccherinum ochraceum TaxID=92696 RepID=A0A4R0R4C5_9APHY|nr:hypothetical protein EIP91_007293 [Steccherinum ochraceum]